MFLIHVRLNMVIENGEMLDSVSDCCKNQQMCNKAVNTHPSTIQFVPECYKTQEISDKTVNMCFLYSFLLLSGIKLKICLAKLFLKILF